MLDCLSKNKCYQWLGFLKPGDAICNCRYEHVVIVSIDLENDSLTYRNEDGSEGDCSPLHCIDPANHDVSMH
jgi:hypothetical protein